MPAFPNLTLPVVGFFGVIAFGYFTVSKDKRRLIEYKRAKALQDGQAPPPSSSSGSSPDKAKTS